ncbi:MAG: hypothetical protein CL843_14775 [Crocinitomicaceae bacterium]|nr:hypothetical protein [Crocinitomicaceae bacterium]
MNGFIQHIALLFTLLWSSTLFGQQAIARYDTNQILIGDQVTVTLELQANTTDEVTWAKFDKPTLSEHIEWVDTSGIDTSIHQTTAIYHQTVHITSFDSGVWAVPPFQFNVNGDTVETKAFVVTVQTMEVDTAEAFKDIKGPLDVPLTLKELFLKYWWVGAIAGGIFIIAFIIVYLATRKKKTPPPAQPEQQISPEEWAFNALEQLEQEALWQNNKAKEYHIRWSEIMREYLQKAYQIPAMESTTAEIELLLKRTALSSVLKEQIIQAFRISDMVKFAKVTPLQNDNLFCLEICRNVVQARIEHLRNQQNQQQA